MKCRLAVMLCLQLVAGNSLAGGMPPGQESAPLRILDLASLELIELPASIRARERDRADLVIAGGGLGGVAAALAACEAGLKVMLCEEGFWLGGQLSAQGVSALDENRWVEGSGSSRSYQALRQLIRRSYASARRPVANPAAPWDPGRCWASGLAFEPLRGAAAVDSLLNPWVEVGSLRLLRRHKALRLERRGERLAWVDFLDLESGVLRRLSAAYFLDATDLSDLFRLAEAPRVHGAEARSESGESQAPLQAGPDCVQSFCYPFVVEFRPGEDHRIPAPPDYLRFRAEQPYRLSAGGEGEAAHLFATAAGDDGPFWTYRRLIHADSFRPADFDQDIALINVPSLDFRGGSLLGTEIEAQRELLLAARSLSLGYLHWLQHEAPRPDGGRGYPELKPRPDLMGSKDGLSQMPYIRESPRVATLSTLSAEDMAAASLPGALRGRFFPDAVAIGHYGMAIHPGPCGRPPAAPETRPFQIPLGALIPLDLANLLPAGKNFGATQLAASAARTHPVEWAVGEAAACLAAECLARELSPRTLHGMPEAVSALQRRLLDRGAPIYWSTNLAPDHICFVEGQLQPFSSEGARSRLERSSELPCP